MDDKKLLEQINQYIENITLKGSERKTIQINCTAQKLAKLLGYMHYGNKNLPEEFIYRGHYLVPTKRP
jgi:hypothetical protein